MRKTTIASVLFISAVSAFGAVACVDNVGESSREQGIQLSGAIFTTNINGTRVNQNIYTSKARVWLDGGPGPNAPVGAAGLPAGLYYFQVTDPSGQTILSQDPVGCRRVTVNAAGVISAYTPDDVPGVTCFHLTATDTDHAAQGAITVQLIPYADTPNNGNEYKVWFSPDSTFPNNQSKTDNFKVIAPPPVCGDGNLDQGEQCDDGNTVNTDGCTNDCKLPVCGDGIVQSGEQCDDGNTDNNDSCTNDCKLAACGDGIVQDGEECDDGNTADGDGCSSSCTKEKTPCCGDGVLDAGEQCDDGNTSDGDGCSSTCQLECPPV